MKSYLDLIPIWAKVHQKQTRMTLFCIILAVFLVTVIFGMADMEIRSQKIKAVKDYGNWHIMLRQMKEEDAELISARPDVAASAWYDVLNYRLKDNYDVNGKEAVICGFEKNFITDIMTGTVIVEGEFPADDTGVVLTRNAREFLGIQLGGTVTLNTPSGEPVGFTVTGFVENSAMITKEDALGVFMNISAFKSVYQKANDTQRLDADMAYYVQFAEHCDINKAVGEIKEHYGLEEQDIAQNTALLGVMGQSNDSYMLGLYLAAFVLFLLVLTAGVLMIASSLNSSIARRTEFFGMMRCIGAEKKQIIRFVRLEALRWCKTAIPAGVGAGILVIWGLCAALRYLSPGYFDQMPVFGISWGGIAAGILVGILTVLLAAQAPAKKAAKVSPLAAMSGNASSIQTIRKAANTRFSKIDTALGVHHAKMNKKNFILMVGSFALSIILFLAFSAVLEFMHHAIRPLKPYTPDVSIVSPDNTCSVPAGFVEEIKQNPHIKRVYGRMFSYHLPVEVNHEERQINLVSYEQHQFDWAEAFLLEGEIEKAAEGDNFILTVYDPQNPRKPGDHIRFQNGEEATVAGVLSDSPFTNDPGVETIICSETLFRRITGEKDYTVIDVQLSGKATESDVMVLRNMAGTDLAFSDRRLSNQEAKGAYWSMALFIYGFLAVIALITVFNIINSISMSVSARIRQYGAMRAIGMADRQLLRMITAEAATYAVGGSIVGCVLGLPVHKYLFESLVTSHWGDPWQVPLAALAVIICIVVISAFAAVRRPSKQIREMTVTDTINAQ